MLETQGRVVKVDNGIAFVETQRPSGCGQCDAQGGCASSTLAKVFGGRATLYGASNPIGARPGDLVLVGVHEGALVKSSFAVYLLPLVLVVLGAAAAGYFAPAGASRDAHAIAGALAGLGASYVWIRLFAAWVGTSPRFQPIILRRLSR